MGPGPFGEVSDDGREEDAHCKKGVHCHVVLICLKL